MSSSDQILEGFLCPLCMKDLGDVIQLQIHFEENHSKEDQAFLQSIKDLFGKAKKKILSDEEQQLENNVVVNKVKYTRIDDTVHPVSGIRRDLYPKVRDTDLGRHADNKTSHFAYLKKIRSERVDRYAAETNRLIVRLDRLLDNMPTDAGKRRTHEQTVVDWIDENLVKQCPSCTRSFNIARRKHHCRLCGSVMCKDCSKFVEWNFCRKLINPSTLSIYSMKSTQRQGWSVNGHLDTRSVGSPAGSGKPGFMRRSGSKESLLSVSEPRNAEEFRICEYCDRLLKHRDAAIELQTNKPIITQFYDKLREQMVKGEELSEQYTTMWESLSRGETTYHLQDAKTVRMKLLKIGESVDLVSKKIAELGKSEAEESAEAGGGQIINSRRFLLQTQIRRASVNFIKDTLVGLPSLPSEERLVELQKQRQEETARRVEEERRKAREAKLRFQNLQEKRQDVGKTKLPHSKSDQSIKYEKGFVLSSSGAEDTEAFSSEDPMIQQMNIIRNYIKRAREANRYDEVGILESNLRELQLEYQKSLEEKRLAEQNSTNQQTDEQYSEDLNPFHSDSEDNETKAVTQKRNSIASTPSNKNFTTNNSSGQKLNQEENRTPGGRKENYTSGNYVGQSYDSSTSSVGGGPQNGRHASSAATTPSSSEDGSTSSSWTAGSGMGSSHTSPAGFKDLASKPVLNEMASAFRNVRNNLSNKSSILNNLNPFGGGESGEEDEYDASGKNPFSE